MDPCFRRGGRGVHAGALMEREGRAPLCPQPFLRKQESIPFRGHDDAPTVIPAPEQESIPGARGRPRPISPDVPPSFLRSLFSWKRGAGIHPFPRARRRPNRHSCPRAGIHPPHAHPQIPANNPQLTPIHFLTCVVEFPIGYGFSIAHSQNGPLEHVAIAR